MSTAVYLTSAVLLLAATAVVFRVFVRRDYRRRGRLTILSTILECVVFSLLGIFTYMDWPPGWPRAGKSVFVRAVAWFCIIGGAAAVLWAMAWLGFRRALGQKVNISAKPASMRSPGTHRC
jgi:hypothetical protein